MPVKLYELRQAYTDLLNMVDEDDADQLIKDTLESLKDSIEIKAENIAKLIRSIELEAAAVKVEEGRMTTRRHRLEKKRDFFKQYVMDEMLLCNITRIKTPTITVSIQNSAPSVQIEDEEKVPTEFIRVNVTTTVDKAAIAELLKAGQEIAGAKLFQGQHIRIR